MDIDRSSLAWRVKRLEQQNFYLRMFVIMGCCVILMAAASPIKESKASAFMLTDQNGMVRAELAIKDGTVGLFILDEQGNQRLSAIHDHEETGLFIKDEAGTSRIGVAQFAHGGGGVALHGENSKGAAVLYFKESGSLRFFNDTGEVTNQLTAKQPE